MFDQVPWATAEILDRGAVDVDAHIAIQRSVDFLEMHRPIDGMLGMRIGGTDYLAGAHSAPEHQGAANSWPVVAATLTINAWGATEFSGDHE